MRVLYYNCFAGISGDMHLGAMIDLGVPEEYLRAELKKLALDAYEMRVTRDRRRGIAGTRVDVVGESHHHRELSDIEEVVNRSDLNNAVKQLALEMFNRLAAAEANVHDTNVENVHFHEVGAVDAIVDIVGAAICVDYLKPDAVYGSAVELGGGFAKCAHGTFPVPAPATLELLKGIPVTSGKVQYEATTPTGAAIFASIVDSVPATMEFVVKEVGYGIGARDDENIPNVLRLCMAEFPGEQSAEGDGDLIIECNIDDMNPEYYEHVFDLLFEAGAKDVYLTPIIMKKSRPATTLSVLSGMRDERRIEEIILKETSTLGVRKYAITKSMLDRRTETIATKYGDVRVKTAFYEGKKIKSKPEHEDCRRIARENDLTLSEVYALVERLTNS